MTRAALTRGALGGAAVVLLAVGAGYLALRREVQPAATPPPAIPPSSPSAAEAHSAAERPAPETYQGFLYGRIDTVDGATYEGRLRWGGSEEAFWDDDFNGTKSANPWLAQVPPERRPMERHPIAIFGIEIARREKPSAVVRPFKARFGEIARLEASGDRVRVTRKNGTVLDLDRFEASDFDDDVRVWDARRGVVDLGSLRIRSIELLPTPALRAPALRLHGTVRTRQGDFTGFVGWNRESEVGSDELHGETPEGERRLRLDAIRSIARQAGDGAEVTLFDGSGSVLSDIGRGHRGIYVADRRYGRVLVSWDAFERVDFSPPGQSGSGPAYGDIPAGSPLAGSVTRRGGGPLAGRLVFDLDESTTSETLDASSRGVDYSLPLGLIASIALSGSEAAGARGVRVTLHTGEELDLEPTGDLGEGNGGTLIFVDGRERPEYVLWSEVERVDFDAPLTREP